MLDQVKSEMTQLMNKTIESLKYQLTKIRTGRASVNVLDGIQVDYYGVQSPINQVGQISIPEARLLQIQPFDKTMIATIEKAILAANIGLTPSNDGNLIRIPFPSLTEERRKDQIKEIKKISEEAKIAMRNIRREQNEITKKAQKNKEISEDELKKYQQEIQKVTDSFIEKVDEIIQSKEQELLNV